MTDEGIERRDLSLVATGRVLYWIGMALEAAEIIALIGTLLLPRSRWIDSLGLPIAGVALLLTLATGFYLVGPRALIRRSWGRADLVFRYLWREGRWFDWVQVVALVGGVALLVWIFASGQGNYTLSSAHGDYFGYTPRDGVRRHISAEQFDHLARITFVWTPIAISLILTSPSVLAITSRLHEHRARLAERRSLRLEAATPSGGAALSCD